MTWGSVTVNRWDTDHSRRKTNRSRDMVGPINLLGSREGLRSLGNFKTDEEGRRNWTFLYETLEKSFGDMGNYFSEDTYLRDRPGSRFRLWTDMVFPEFFLNLFTF